MHEAEKIELTNMCMIYDNENNVLVQNRKKSWCGIAFPGGHVETLESIVESTIREVKEETGLDIKDLKLCGVKQWFHKGIRNICFLFKTNVFEGTLVSNDEGENFWIKINEINNYKLAVNFDVTLKLFLGDKYVEHYRDYSLEVGRDILR